MPLPTISSPWPPDEIIPAYIKMQEWAAWYSGEPARLADFYAGDHLYRLHMPQQGSGVGFIGTHHRDQKWRFWSRAREVTEGKQKAMFHVPVASDLAGVSASLLFGDPPIVRIKNAHDTTAATGTQETETRMIELLEMNDGISKLVEAAEASAAIGGVYIYPAWDKNVRPWPFITYAQSDQAVPTFSYGYLTAVTFHRILEMDGERVWRHLECHEVVGGKAQITHGLYYGTRITLGEQRPMTSRTETKDLQSFVQLPFDELDVEYIPNIRPNRLWRSSGLGVADIQGSEIMLDAVDETYASWMRDIRLAKARIIVPQEFLEVDYAGRSSFDVDQEIYAPLSIEPSLDTGGRSMMAHQFQIRFNEHRETVTDLIRRIVSNAGYSLTTTGQGYGAEEPRVSTASGLRIAEHKTILTLRKKGSFWKRPVENVLEKMMIIDKEMFDGTCEPMRPTLVINSSIAGEPLEMAQTVLAMKSAESASIETRVRTLHAEWNEDEIQAEVKRIKDDQPAPPQIIGAKPFGAPHTDPASTGNLPTTLPGKAPTNAPPMPAPMAKKA